MRIKAFLNLMILGAVCASNGTGTAGHSAPTDHAVRLVEGVSAIGRPGVVGQIAVWGDDAFAIAVGRSRDVSQPIAAATTLGRGRIVAFAHGYASAASAAQHDTGTLLANACAWLAEPLLGEGGGRPRIGLFKCNLETFVRERGFEPVSITGGEDMPRQLHEAGIHALLSDTGDLTDAEARAIEQFVRSGGGFLCCACPWGWAQVRRKEVEEIPLNRILEQAGLAFTDGTVDPTLDDGFAVGSAPGAHFNASHAIDVLLAVETGERKPNEPIVKQAGATLERAAGALPRDDRMLRPRLEAMLHDRADALAPTPTNPLRANRPLDRALLAMQVAELERTPAHLICAHPSAAAFPGEVPTDAPRITRTVAINPTTPDWLSTGLYAPPGEMIRIRVASPGNLRVRIGCHKDQIWHHDRWQRVPRITQAWRLTSPETSIASAFGGLIYIESPGQRNDDAVQIEIAGAVEAPLFVLGETSDAEWIDSIRHRPAPWAELACDGVILTVPAEVARRIEQPTTLMQHWSKVMDACADLATIDRNRRRPERFVTDVQISAGYMHSGYPIMTHLDAAEFITSLSGVCEKGWGPYHELGHNHQQGDWTFDGTVEVTCNLFTLYVLEKVCGVAVIDNGRVLDPKSFENMRKHLETDGKWARWKRDPFLALQMYALMQQEFGWDAYKQVFAEYRALPREQRPRNDDEKRDQWLTRFSRTVGRNLGPYFEAWGVPTSSEARQSISHLPVWMPQSMQPQ